MKGVLKMLSRRIFQKYGIRGIVGKDFDFYDMLHIGMAAGTKTASIRGRLRVHRRRRGKLWSLLHLHQAVLSSVI